MSAMDFLEWSKDSDYNYITSTDLPIGFGLPEEIDISKTKEQISIVLKEIGFTEIPYEETIYSMFCCRVKAIEERFEELTTHYDRADDEIKAPLRSSLMEMVEDRLDFLSELASADDKVPAADAEKLRRLALVSGKANELIKLLNREEFMPDPTEAERLEAQIENLLDEQDAAFEELRREQ